MILFASMIIVYSFGVKSAKCGTHNFYRLAGFRWILDDSSTHRLSLHE